MMIVTRIRWALYVSGAISTAYRYHPRLVYQVVTLLKKVLLWSILHVTPLRHKEVKVTISSWQRQIFRSWSLIPDLTLLPFQVLLLIKMKQQKQTHTVKKKKKMNQGIFFIVLSFFLIISRKGSLESWSKPILCKDGLLSNFRGQLPPVTHTRYIVFESFILFTHPR